MALPSALHNRTNVRFKNKVGTNLESLPNFPREFIGGSGGYGAKELQNLEDEIAPGIPPMRTNQRGSETAQLNLLAFGCNLKICLMCCVPICIAIDGRRQRARIGRTTMTTTSSPALSLRNETPGIALWRLYLLRAGYLLIAIGMGMQQVPAFLHHKPWELMQGVVHAMLLSLVLLSVVGLRYPLKMLPVLFWEIIWKTTWLLAVALPAWQNHTMDADTWDTTFACLMSAIFLFVIPWDYVWRMAARGDRWR